MPCDFDSFSPPFSFQFSVTQDSAIFLSFMMRRKTHTSVAHDLSYVRSSVCTLNGPIQRWDFFVVCLACLLSPLLIHCLLFIHSPSILSSCAHPFQLTRLSQYSYYVSIALRNKRSYVEISDWKCKTANSNAWMSWLNQWISNWFCTPAGCIRPKFRLSGDSAVLCSCFAGEKTKHTHWFSLMCKGFVYIPIYHLRILIGVCLCL